MQVNYHEIETLNYPVFLGDELWTKIGEFLYPYLSYSGVYILTDENVHRFCLPALVDNIPGFSDIPVYSLPASEKAKEVTALEDVWKWLINNGASRDSILVNLGGGVVSDLGGFAAATFNRGMSYINIPTSLIGQADAAIGGKTGINLLGMKNQAGLFADPAAVFIMPSFLKTVPELHIKSGWAEIIKSAALAGGGFWDKLKNLGRPDNGMLFDLIAEAVRFKCGVVAADPYDLDTRKILNFGHTVGHSLESLYLALGHDEYTHGEAVASGMICEAWISGKLTGMPENEIDQLTGLICNFFELKAVEERHYAFLSDGLKFDKKKTAHGTGYSLLENIGKPLFGKTVGQSTLLKSFNYYNSKATK
jgi:3-dehydroquinate synthase